MSNRTNLKVLVVDGDGTVRRSLVNAVEAAGWTAAQAATAADARSRLEGFAYDGLILDARLPDGDGLDVFEDARRRYPGLQAVVTTGFASVHQAVKALKAGACDYLRSEERRVGKECRL